MLSACEATLLPAQACTLVVYDVIRCIALHFACNDMYLCKVYIVHSSAYLKYHSAYLLLLQALQVHLLLLLVVVLHHLWGHLLH
jgi:hypothetical protein